VRATADNLLAWATPMTASPISGAHSEIGLIESAYEPLCGPVLWELYGPIAIVSPRRRLELPPTFREVNGTR